MKFENFSIQYLKLLADSGALALPDSCNSFIDDDLAEECDCRVVVATKAPNLLNAVGVLFYTRHLNALNIEYVKVAEECGEQKIASRMVCEMVAHPTSWCTKSIRGFACSEDGNNLVSAIRRIGTEHGLEVVIFPTKNHRADDEQQLIQLLKKFRLAAI